MRLSLREMFRDVSIACVRRELGRVSEYLWSEWSVGGKMGVLVVWGSVRGVRIKKGV